MECRVLFCVLISFFVFIQSSIVECYHSSHRNSNNNNVVVNTNLGRIRGAVLKTRLGKSFYAFRGIRYAKPPVNELRFQAPQPVEPWTDVFDATDDGPRCPQPSENSTENSEDCLRLNVYTDELPSHSRSVKKPVIIYIHPSAFYLLSGQSKNYAAPQLLMDRDVVLVTFNYRLGSLGYLATGTREAPGNAGFKDQVMVMKWVQQHISKFGGDPNSVTLVGYSAGGWSITLHMVSPMSKNLFHRAIVASASGIGQWGYKTEGLDLAKRQAALAGCPQNNIPEMVQCLKKQDMLLYTNVTGMFELRPGIQGVLWNAVIEPDFGQERFLVEDPKISYKNGNLMRIPVIAGITKDEIVEAAINVLNSDKYRNDFYQDFERIAPICFLYERDTPRSQNISREIRAAYLGSEPLTMERSLEGLKNLFSDSIIGFPIHRFVHLASKHTTVYYYRFSYQGRYSLYKYPDDKPFGVVHLDDLLYSLPIVGVAPFFTKSDPEDRTVERLTRMWTQFAKTGNPNKPNDEYLRDLNWTPFTSIQENYLDFGDSLVMKNHLYTDRYAIWDRLFPIRN